MKDFLKDNVWVWAGALVVIFTLSGEVQRTVIVVSVIAAAAHALLSIGKDE